MSFGKKVTLSSGHEIPLVGYGTWQAAPGEVGQGVLEALKAGYRHLDLALMQANHQICHNYVAADSDPSYENQREVAQGIKKAFAEVPGLKREDIFITSKLWNHTHSPQDVEAALEGCLAELELDYLDLYLIHWPVAFVREGETYFPKAQGSDGECAIDDSISLAATWKAMTQLSKSKVRSVGVSNFSTAHLDAVIGATGVVPAVNQIERHPRLPNPTLINYCKDKNIHITAYSAFGNNSQNVPLLVTSSEIKAVAERLSGVKGKTVTPAQVILAWSQVGGHSVIPKSVTPSRIRENFEEVELEPQDVEAVSKLGNEAKRFNIPIEYSPKWSINIFGEECEKAAKHQVITGA